MTRGPPCLGKPDGLPRVQASVPAHTTPLHLNTNASFPSLHQHIPPLPPRNAPAPQTILPGTDTPSPPPSTSPPPARGVGRPERAQHCPLSSCPPPPPSLMAHVASILAACGDPGAVNGSQSCRRVAPRLIMKPSEEAVRGSWGASSRWGSRECTWGRRG